MARNSYTTPNGVKIILPGKTIPAIWHTESDTHYFTATDWKDVFFGSAGLREVDYSFAGKGITINLVVGRGYAGADGDQFHGILDINGSAFNDRIIGSNANNQFWGNDGNDALYGQGGHDRLFGGNGNDYLNGGSGNDVISGGAGRDKIIGGYGDDNLIGGDGRDDLRGGYGKDFLDGGTGRDQLRGGKDSDSLFGKEGDDELYGGGGADVLYGGAGHDKLFGNNGNDYISSDDDGNEIDGGNGSQDWVRYNILSTGVAVDLSTGIADFVGSTKGDTIVNIENVLGSEHDDEIVGDAADNILRGQWGEDIIDGGQGNDILSGGYQNSINAVMAAQSDTFVFRNNDSNGNQALRHGNDIINDFGVGVDKIDLSDTEVNNFNDLLTPGDRYMEQVGDDTVIYTINGVDGDSITLQDVQMANLSSDDFIF